MKTTVAAFLVLAGLSFASGCSSGGATNEVSNFGATKSAPAPVVATATPAPAPAPAPAKVAMANTKCPLRGTAVNPEMTAEWNGQKVGFCCAGCKSGWAKLSDADKQSKLAAAK